MISNTVRTVATRAVSRRAMSDAAGPKLHKAKDAWKQLETTRPPEGHPHVSSMKMQLVAICVCLSIALRGT